MKRWGLLLATLLSVSLILLPGTSAAEEVAGRLVYHTQKVETMEVGDVPGHVIGVIQQPGILFFTKGPDAGKIASRVATVHFDAVNGKGTASGYTVATFQDGTTLNFTSSATMTPIDGGKKLLFEGTWEYAGGTGRFAGTNGKGTLKGERIGSPKTGGDTYIDFTGTEWK